MPSITEETCANTLSAAVGVKLPSDVFLLVLDQMVGDSTTLSAVGLVCQKFRAISLPFLLRNVDISSHNNGRLPEEEGSMEPEVYADYDGRYRPDHMVPRQHAFLRLMTDRPELAGYVQSFTWTLIWESVEAEEPDSVENETWAVFARFRNVTRLDLGSLHFSCYQPIVRQNPSKLFPAVKHLKLLGWMHRGLVEAIMTSLDSTTLRSLSLNRLQDEGAMSDGSPISLDVVNEIPSEYRGTDGTMSIDEQLYRRQRSGNALVLPGPMWYALRLLSERPLNGLARLEITMPQCDMHMDVRSYHAMFRETAKMIDKLRSTLRALKVVLPVSWMLYDTEGRSVCGTGRHYRPIHLAWTIRMAAYLLHGIALTLSEGPYPRLNEATFEGFQILELAKPPQDASALLQETRRAMLAAQQNLGIPVDFVTMPHLDYRVNSSFNGHDTISPENEGWRATLAGS